MSHAYAFDVALKTFREHAFLKDLLKLFHSRSRKHGTHACRKQFSVSFGTWLLKALLFLESPTKFPNAPLVTTLHDCPLQRLKFGHLIACELRKHSLGRPHLFLSCPRTTAGHAGSTNRLVDSCAVDSAAAGFWGAVGVLDEPRRHAATNERLGNAGPKNRVPTGFLGCGSHLVRGRVVVAIPRTQRRRRWRDRSVMHHRRCCVLGPDQLAGLVAAGD